MARNQIFKELAHDIAMQIVAMDPQNNEELLVSSFIKNPELTIEAYLNSKILVIGENIKIGKFSRFQI